VDAPPFTQARAGPSSSAWGSEVRPTSGRAVNDD
jgi:hypothetical protein